jgi:Skp family chaperone for outer membrane proteins
MMPTSVMPLVTREGFLSCENDSCQENVKNLSYLRKTLQCLSRRISSVSRTLKIELNVIIFSPFPNRRFVHIARFSVLLAALIIAFPALAAREKSAPVDYGAGLSVRVPVSEPELLQAVEDVVDDGIIQGTKEYNKDEYVSGAVIADRTPAFDKWPGPGRVFYKVRKNAIDPRNFKDTNDAGTLAVRYVIQHADDKSTILKIDAVFLDDLHLRIHPSNGSVEAAEYKDIEGHLASMQLKRQEAVAESERKQQQLASEELKSRQKQQQLEATLAQAPDESLQQHVQKLRREAERMVGKSGASLRAAPFRSALSQKALAAGTQVVILVSTPYWYGVETEDGQHGWIHRSELELLP